jgi:hypothetical protein
VREAILYDGVEWWVRKKELFCFVDVTLFGKISELDRSRNESRLGLAC